MGVVGVARVLTACAHILETADENGSPWILDVDHVKAAAAGFAALTRPHCVGEAGLLVDYDVVGTRDPAVVSVLLEGHGVPCDLPQLGEVEDLHAVGT